MATIKIRDWVEPAHPVLVKRFEDIVAIYRFLKEAIQAKVDTAFDKASQQIGFVVTTTLPVALQVAEGGKIERIEFAAKSLQGSIFEKEFAPIFKEIVGKQPARISGGSYSLFLIWHDALKLKLKADWIEPAHFRQFDPGLLRAEAVETAAAQLAPGIREPAHWFHAAALLDREEEILIAAIDEVYTDLKLAERVAVARRETMKYIPGVREPAHFRDIIDNLVDLRASGRAEKLIPGIREPAHFRRLLEREDFVRLLTELADMMKKYGV